MRVFFRLKWFRKWLTEKNVKYEIYSLTCAVHTIGATLELERII